MKKKIIISIYILFLVFSILFNLTVSIYVIWTSKLWKILFYICFIPLLIISIYAIIFIFFVLNAAFSFFYNHDKLFLYCLSIFSKVPDIIENIYLFLNIILIWNNMNYNIYIRNCPFTINSDIITYNNSIYENRKCELYDINNNSRYKFQYICTYNASKDFEGDKTKDGFNQIICIPKVNNIRNNDIINKFNKIYDNEYMNKTKLFYCSLIEAIKKDEYIKDEYCLQKNNFSHKILLLLLSMMNILMFINKQLSKKVDTIIDNRFASAVERLRELRLYINRLSDDSDKITVCDESNLNDISFHEEEDTNIIVENHQVVKIDLNIKEFIENEKHKKD